MKNSYTSSSRLHPELVPAPPSASSSIFVTKKDRFGLKGNTIAGTFRVDDVVAEGGFGIVYRAFHLHFRSPVALKCLKIPGELSQEQRTEFLEQFRSEAEIQFHLSASLPNIVRPLHVDAVTTKTGEFVPLMALEWLEGKSFEKIIEERTFAGLPPMPLDEALELISPAAQALHEAHDFEIDGERVMVVHRDIKPDNLFVTEIGGKKVVKLLDFGISKVRRVASHLGGQARKSDTQAPFSPAYGAPEQWVPKRFGPTGAWTDVWGLALTLVEIIKGDAVIVGDHRAMMGTALDPKVRPTPRSEGVSVSDEVESVFLKALSLEPRYRYPSIQAFWDALSAAIALSPPGTGFEETPSGRRLPVMRPPTPWTPPHLRFLKIPTDAPENLPAMMAPAPFQPTLPEDMLEPGSSYPTDPNSGLQPVPAAPVPWEHLEADIPPILDETDREPLYAPLQTPQEVPRPSERTFTPAESEVPLQLELQPTSMFPEERKSSPRVWHAVGDASHGSDPLPPQAPSARAKNAAQVAPSSSARAAIDLAPLLARRKSAAKAAHASPTPPTPPALRTPQNAAQTRLAGLDLIAPRPKRPPPPRRGPARAEPETVADPPSSQGNDPIESKSGSSMNER